jgi:crossover junction endodeoxyribonuclease RuvC
MRILGIDCGTAITGWAVLETKGPKLLACGTIETSKYTPEEHRLLDLGSSIRELLEEFNPDDLAIEDLFFFRNATTVIKVSQARGVVIYEAAKKGLRYFSYTPPQVKQRITGYGKADKQQMIFMVNKILKLEEKVTQDDAADAVAIAYCHYLAVGDK